MWQHFVGFQGLVGSKGGQRQWAPSLQHVSKTHVPADQAQELAWASVNPTVGVGGAVLTLKRCERHF